MSIYDTEGKINPGTDIPFGDNPASEKRLSFNDKIKPLYTLILILVIASIFFALGRLSSLEKQKEPIKIINPTTLQAGSAILAVPEKTPVQKTTVTKAQAVQTATTTPAGGKVIGVKTSKKYYFPWCGVMKRVKPENKVPFASYEAARAAGYVPGGGCKGLK